MSTADRRRRRPLVASKQPKPLVQRVADWARVLVFVGIGLAVAARLGGGRSLGRWDLAALIVAAAVLPGARSVVFRSVKEIARVVRGR